MKSALMKIVCRFLIVSVTMLSFQSAYAGMIGTDRVAGAASSQVDRANVLNMLNRAEVADQLALMGVDPQATRERVAAMSDQEIQTLTGQLGALPAGADGAGLLLLIIVLGVIYWLVWKR